MDRGATHGMVCYGMIWYDMVWRWGAEAASFTFTPRSARRTRRSHNTHSGSSLSSSSLRVDDLHAVDIQQNRSQEWVRSGMTETMHSPLTCFSWTRGGRGSCDHLYPDLYDLFDGAVVAAAVVAVFHEGYACVVTMGG